MSRRRSTSDASAPAEGRSRSSSDASDALGTSPAQGPLPGVMVRKNPTQREPGNSGGNSMGGSNSSGGGVAGAQPASSMPTSSFGPSRVDVVVLCGSAGSRLFPLTASPGSPKCLLPLANQPVLSYLLASLAKLGFVTVHLATTAEFQAPLQAFLAMYQGPQPKHVHLFVAPPECGGTAEALQAMRSGGQLPGSDDKGAAAAASGGGGSDSATAPLSPSSLSSQLRGENVLVVPGECVVESQLLDLLDLHQRQGSDLTMLLAKESQMGADADTAGDSSSGGGGGGGGGKAAAAAKAKAAGGAKKPKRDPEDVEYVGLCSLTDSASNQGDHSYGTASSGSSSANGKNSCVGQRLMLKVPALAVEEDLQVPKTLLARAALLGHGGGRLQLRTDLNDPHVYVFSKWALSLLDASKPGRLVSLKNDLVPYLLSRQFRDPNPTSSSSSSASGGVLPQGFGARDRRFERAIAAVGSGGSSARARAGLLPDVPALSATTAAAAAASTRSSLTSASPPYAPVPAPAAESAESTAAMAPLVLGGGGSSGTPYSFPPSPKTGRANSDGFGDFRSSSPSGDYRTNSPAPGTDGACSWYDNPENGGSGGSGTVAVHETCRCLALVCAASAPSEAGSRFLCRLTTVPQYLEANRLVVAWDNSVAASSSLGKGAAPWGKLVGLRSQGSSSSGGGHPSAVAEGAVLESKVQMRRAVVGAGCKVGAQAKLNDCVVMAGAKIGAGAIVQGSVVCSGATVGDGAVLKNCQVAANFAVPGGTKGVDESFNARPGAQRDSDDSGDDGDGSGDDAFDQMPSAPEDA